MGMGYASKYVDKIDNKYFVMLGDAEVAEGQIWEACNFGAYYHLDNVVAIVDVNRFGQTCNNMFDHDMNSYKKKFEAFGCHTIIIDGHDIAEIIMAMEWARQVKDAPAVIVAKTIKGKNFSPSVENQDWHGKSLGQHHEPSVTRLNALISNHETKLEPLQPEAEAKMPEFKPFKFGSLDYCKGISLYCLLANCLLSREGNCHTRSLWQCSQATRRARR